MHRFDTSECRPSNLTFNSTIWNTDREIPRQQQQQQQRQQQQQPQQQQLQQQQMTRLVKLIMGSSSEKLRSHAPVARSPFAGCSVCLWTHCLFPIACSRLPVIGHRFHHYRM